MRLPKVVSSDELASGDWRYVAKLGPSYSQSAGYLLRLGDQGP